jgi:hypothetical protein
MLDDIELQPVLDQLTGVASEKPFDCVGTVKEVNLALCELIRQYDTCRLPRLLDYYHTLSAYRQYRDIDFHSVLTSFDPHHYVPEDLFRILKSALNG